MSHEPLPTEDGRASRILQPMETASIRFVGEETYASQLLAIPGLLGIGAEGVVDTSRIRRRLLAQSLLLSEGMAPAVYALARECAERFGIAAPIELYQADGAENAAMHLLDSPVLLEVQGKLLALLDDGALSALLGHELGHYLAHGLDGPHAPLIGALTAIFTKQGVAEDVLVTALRYSMARELTADRFGLLACGDLDAALRLEMVVVTGLSSDTLTWDTQAYLAQSRALIEETLAQGETTQISTHPEHSLRAYALWLFSETDLFRALTGKGPGSRSVAEVDAVLMRILGAPSVQLGMAELLDEPPPEMHECALAACVLMAFADGEMHDSELEAIERVFAPLLGHWRELLDPDTALARFQALAPLVINAGPKMQRALFVLLTHVLAADGEAHEGEVEVLLGIGSALGCLSLYRELLRPVLDHFGLEPELLTGLGRVIPMPARVAEAKEALRVYVEETARRGSGRVTLRRLLRLMGEQSANAQVLDEIQRGLTRADLLCEPALGESLDTLHELRLTPERAASREAHPPAPPVGLGEEGARLRNGLARLRDQLISGDGRSPSVRLRRCRTGASLDLYLLERVSTGLAERTLTLLRSHRRARLLDAAETGVHEGAKQLARELVALDREHRARLEESGAHDLHLGYPFLTGVVNGYLFRAPLLLFPVHITRDNRGEEAITLRPVEGADTLINQSALRMIFSRRGSRYTEEMSERLDAAAQESVEVVVETLAALGLPTMAVRGELTAFHDRSEELDTWRDDRLELEECAVLGLFPQSSSELLQDYDELLAALDRGESAAQLLGCAVDLLPEDLKAHLATPFTPVDAEAAAPVPVIYADPSQRAVLSKARATRTLVVDGPPGTGKSQVIVNLVADALARGERVAVVCEKRAALDVVANRLEGVGLRHLLAVVHDVQEDRRALYDQVNARLSDDERRRDPLEAIKGVAGEVKGLFAGLKEKAVVLATRHLGLALSELHTYASSFVGVTAARHSGVEGLTLAQVEALAADMERLRPFADLWAEGSLWLAPQASVTRQRVSGFDATQRAELTRAMQEAVGAAKALEASCVQQAQAPDSLALLQGSRSAILAVRDGAPRRASADMRSLFLAALSRAEAGGSRLDAFDQLQRQWRDAASAVARFDTPVDLALDVAQQQALEVIVHAAGGLGRYLSPAWWRARGVLRRVLLTQWPEMSAAPIDLALAGALRDRQQAAAFWRALEGLALMVPDLTTPQRAGGIDAWLGEAAAVLRDAFAIACLRPTLEPIAAWPRAWLPPLLDEWERQLGERLELLELAERLAAVVRPVTTLVPWLEPLPPSRRLEELLASWLREGERLAEADRWLASASAVYPSAESLLRQLASAATALPGSWADAVRKGWAQAAVEVVQQARPQLQRVDAESGQGDALLGQRLGRQLAEYAELHVERILARQDERPLLQVRAAEKGKRRTPEQALVETLQKETRKKSRLLPLRTFTRRFYTEGLLDLLPVWLLSPETIAVLFPREPVFDLVILDEGSQCTVENGLPVLMRARRGVVAGDEHQMPPTNFFKRAGDDEEIEVSAAREMFDAESLLVLARARAAHSGLQWHYRCLHEELIAFSNHAIYGGGLRTIPSTSSRLAPAAVRWVEVPDAQYEAGVNAREADKVVDLIAELLADPTAPTLGVVTFNLSQRRAILDALDARQVSDPHFAQLYTAAMSQEMVDRRPFVKNLESVQGDERDVILFSLGHAPVERKKANGAVDRYVPARFGPLGQRGGERRLNVAISRAKQSIIVVASFEPELLSVARSRNEGPKLFKAFLEFSRSMAEGRRSQAERVLDRVRASPQTTVAVARDTRPEGYVPLKAQIALALEALGIRCEMDVGSSAFRVDLAIIDPADRHFYRWGILCDEGGEPRTPLETHVHVPNVLAMRGWRLLRVTGREWDRNREGVLASVGKMLGERSGNA